MPHQKLKFSPYWFWNGDLHRRWRFLTGQRWLRQVRAHGCPKRQESARCKIVVKDFNGQPINLFCGQWSRAWVNCASQQAARLRTILSAHRCFGWICRVCWATGVVYYRVISSQSSLTSLDRTFGGQSCHCSYTYREVLGTRWIKSYRRG